MTPILINAKRSRRGWSRIGKFFRCPQSFAWEHVAQLEKRADSGDSGGSHALLKGSLIHLGLAHYYAIWGAHQGGVVVDAELAGEWGMAVPGVEGGALVTDPAAFLRPEEAILTYAQLEPAAAEWIDLALKTVGAYAAHYATEFGTLRVVAVEHEIASNLGELVCPGHPFHGKPLLYTARQDLVWQEPGGQLAVVDHKTSMVPKKSTTDAYAMHGQFLGLRMLGQEHYGERFAGIRINLMKTDGGKFMRPRIEIPRAAQQRFRARLLEAEHAIAGLEVRTKEFWKRYEGSPWWVEDLARRADLTVRDWPAAQHELVCMHRYGKCGAWSLCWGEQ